MNYLDNQEINILVVDDSPDNQATLQKVLTGAGYRTHAALDGALALEFVAARLPDLILLDVMMPVGIDGYEVCRRLKADARTRDIPVIFISALDDLVDKMDAFAAGGVDYIVKPLQPAEVLARVETHLSLRLMQRQLAAQNAQLHQEIHERVQAEAALRASESKYRTLLEHLPQRIFYKDADSIYISCNANYARDLRIAPAEIAGKTDYDFFPPEIAEKYRADDRRICASGQSTELEETYIVNGQECTVRTVKTPVQNAQGTCSGILGIFWDITAHKQAELEYRTIIQTTADGFWIADATGRFVDVNDAYCHLLGYTRAELLTMYISDIEAQEQPEETARHMQNVITRGYDRFETQHRRKDGAIIDVEVSTQFSLVRGGVFVIFTRDITERKRVETALRKFSRAVDQSANTVIITALDGAIEYVNPAFTRVSGYPASEALGQTPRLLKSGEQPPEFYAELWATITRGATWQGEFLNRCKDGTLYWDDAVISPIRDNAGNITHYLGVQNDVTARKRAEETLRLSEERHRLIAALISDYVYAATVNADGSITTEWITGAVERITGYSIEEIKTAEGGWSSFWYAEDRGRAAEILPQLLANHQTDNEYRIVTKSGEIRWLRDYTRPVWDAAAQRVVRLIGAAQDITERKHTEQALRESEQKYRQLVEALQEGIWVIDRAAFTTFVNPRMADMLGYTVAEMQGKHLFDFMDERGQDIAQRNIARRQQGITEQHDFEFRRKDGSRIYTTLETSPLTDDAGNYTGAIAGVVDITERRQMETELHQAKEAAEAANRAKSTFLANMSHELRTPLNAILGYSQLMLRAPDLTPTQRANLEPIGRSGEHLLALINDVLDLSKIEAGRMELYPEVFDLWHMLLGLEEMFRLRAAQAGLQLAVDRAPEVPRHIRADQNKLRQVLINLLGNAVKFTATGSITLHVGQVSIPADSSLGGDTAAMESRPTALEFTVTDTGAGIANDELESIFTPFVQAESALRGQQGTGLGLAISRQYVQLMGGDIAVSSVIGQGSKFKFHVVVEVVTPAAAPQLTAPRHVVGLAAGSPDYRVLVAENEESNRQLLIALLQPLGLAVRGAANGQEAIDIWKTWQPHLIWMDMRMPMLDGYAATRRIKAAPRGAQTVIIALTASAFAEQRAEILAAGCDDFLRKPFNAADIFALMGKHLGIEYIYEDAAPPSVSISAEPELTPELLAALPPALLAELERAVIRSQIDKLKTLAAQARAHDAAAADALARAVDNFAYGQILAAITAP